jgi:hypothetical protein
MSELMFALDPDGKRERRGLSQQPTAGPEIIPERL